MTSDYAAQLRALADEVEAVQDTPTPADRAVPTPPMVRLMPLRAQPSLVAFVTSAPGLVEIRVRIQQRPTSLWWCCDRCARGHYPNQCPHIAAVLAAVQKERNTTMDHDEAKRIVDDPRGWLADHYAYQSSAEDPQPGEGDTTVDQLRAMTHKERLQAADAGRLDWLINPTRS